ncbi:hypothetical protein VPH35_055594 [Triticum aestivum]
MDTTMFDEANPIMEWLNEDEEDPIVDGANEASAVFEKIRHLNSGRKDSYVGTKDNEYVDNESEDDDGVSEDDEDDQQDQQETQMQVEEETQVQAEKETATSVGNLETRRSGRLVRKKTKEVNSLYS